MPILAGRALHGTAVPCYVDESTRLVTERAIGCIFVRPQWRLPDVYPIAIHIEVGAGRRILEVVFPIMFCHRWPFYIATEHGVAMVMAEALDRKSVG